MENYDFLNSIKAIENFDLLKTNINNFENNFDKFTKKSYYPTLKESELFNLILKEFCIENNDTIEKDFVIKILNETEISKEDLKKIWILSFTTSDNIPKEELFLALQLAALKQNNEEIKIENLYKKNNYLFKVRGININLVDNIEFENKNKIDDNEKIKIILDINENLKQQYIDFLNKNNISNLKRLSGVEVKKFINKFKLDNSVNFKIWKLIDYDKKGYLEESQILIFLHLINLAVNYLPVPDLLPNSLKNYILNKNEKEVIIKEDYTSLSSKTENIENNVKNNDLNKNLKKSLTEQILDSYSDTLEKFENENNIFEKKFNELQNEENNLLENIKSNLKLSLIENNKIEELKIIIDQLFVDIKYNKEYQDENNKENIILEKINKIDSLLEFEKNNFPDVPEI